MKNKNKIKISAGERIFDVFNVLFMCAMIIVMIYPVWHVVCYSLSSPAQILSHKGLVLKPMEFSVEAYKAMFANKMILKGYGNTFYILIMSLILNFVMTSMGAYVVTRKDSFISKPIMIMMIVTMYFTGGLIPTYFNIRDLGLVDSHWAIILPASINTFNLIILKSAFAGIPGELDEAAKIDGAGHYRILFGIMLPLSKATMSVILLYYAVAHWNGWFNAMLYLNEREMFPLQLVLREILISNDTSSMTMGADAGERALIAESIKYAVIIAAIVPILCIYPFIQRYFTQGVMIGAVKG